MVEDDSISDVVLLTQLPSDSWFQGTALRPDGRVLASRLDQPELYLFDPLQPDSEPVLLHTFEGASGLINICTLEGCHDEFAVLTAVFDVATFQFEDPIIWKVSFSSKDDLEPKVTKATEVVGAGFCAALVSISPRTLLVADSSSACIWRLDITNGKISSLVADEIMRPVGEGEGGAEAYGVNTVCIGGGYVWFANESAGVLGRAPIELGSGDDGWDIRATGPAVLVTDDIPHPDGLVINKEGNIVYNTNYIDGELRRIDVDPVTGKGETSIILDNLVTPASLEVVYDSEAEKPKYTSCAPARSTFHGLGTAPTGHGAISPISTN